MELSTVELLRIGARATIAVRDLWVRAGGRELLRGIDAEFPSHSVTAIVGPTGCGKTTLLRTLNRLHDEDGSIQVEGRVELDGRDIYREIRDVRELRRRIGMLFQRPNPFPRSIIENVTIGPRVHGLASGKQLRELGEYLLQEVGLWPAVKDRLGDSPFSLSGGQQQLLCLARALSVNPEVLLLDEPTSSLDPRTTSQIEDLIRRLSDRVAIIMVSHNLGQVRRLADQVLFLLDGERVEFSDRATFFEQPSDPRSRRYLAGEAGWV
jgi:phosphate transport system ATP-binding protein